MKIRKINILAALALSVLSFVGCSKDDGPIPKRIGIENVPVITVNTDPQKTSNRDTIKLASPAAFSGKIKVDMFFPGAEKPTKVDIVVRKNNLPTASSTVVNTNVKVLKADVTSFPTTITVTADDIATLFGTALVLSDAYDFGVDIYVGEKKYEAFPQVGLGNGAGVTGMSAIGFYDFVRVIVRP
jgi:hypothetical protein